MDNSIKLKQLQVVNEDIKKEDDMLGILFLFQKGYFFNEEGEDEVIPPLSKRGIF